MKKIFILSTLLLMLSPNLSSAQVTAPNSPSGQGTSHNWAGYVVQNGGNYTSVSASWVIPQPTANGTLAADASWIGIGGVISNDLIQLGTQAIVNADNSISYQAWYEMLPQSSQQLPLTVNPGDSISASISQQSTNQWLLSIRDNTNGQNFQTPVTYFSSLSSAEWIEEMPSSNLGFIPLDNFGILQFSGGQTIQNGTSLNIAQAGGQAMTMINNSGQALVTVSALNPDGASFSVSRTQLAPSVSARSGGFGRRRWHKVGRDISSFNPAPSQTQSSYRRYFIGFGNRFNFFNRLSFDN